MTNHPNRKRTTRKIDVTTTTTGPGGLWLFSPHTRRSRAWIAANAATAATSALSIVVDVDYGLDLAIAMLRDGLRLADMETGRLARLPKEE